MLNASLLRSVAAPDSYARRRVNGSLLIVVGAGCFICFVLGVVSLDFGLLCFYRQRQQSATEAVALCAASRLGQVVIDDEQMGLVGLSDHVPGGKSAYCRGADNYHVRARSINTILATIRQNMIIAGLSRNNYMREIARQDHRQAMLTAEKLARTLRYVLCPGGAGKSYDGDTINPSVEGLKTLRKCLGTQECGILALQLGSIRGASTNIKVPRPGCFSFLTEKHQVAGCYLSGVDVPYDSSPFVFAAVANQACLAGVAHYAENLNELPFQNPSVVKATVEKEWALFGRKVTLHTEACAIPQAVLETKSSAPLLTISYPDGVIPDFRTVSELLNVSTMKDPQLRSSSVRGGDYPGSGYFDNNSTQMTCARLVLAQAFYDWLKATGSGVDIASVLEMLESPMSPGVPSDCPHLHAYRVDEKGTVRLRVLRNSAERYAVIADRQLFAVTGSALQSSRGFMYDVLINDCVNRPGRLRGGIHAGEPLPASILSTFEELMQTVFTGQTQSGASSTPLDRPEESPEPGGFCRRADAFHWSGNCGGWGYATFKAQHCQTSLPPELALEQYIYACASSRNLSRSSRDIPAIAAEVSLRICRIGM